MDSRPVPVTLGKCFFLAKGSGVEFFFVLKGTKKTELETGFLENVWKRSFLKDHMLICFMFFLWFWTMNPFGTWEGDGWQCYTWSHVVASNDALPGWEGYGFFWGRVPLFFGDSELGVFWKRVILSPNTQDLLIKGNHIMGCLYNEPVI